MFTQTLANGLLLGGLYGVAAIGFSLVWGVMGVINLAHTAFITLGAYIAFTLFAQFGLDPLLSAPVSFAALFVVGFLMQWFILNRIMRRNILLTFVITFGIDLMIVNLLVVVFTSDFVAINTAYRGISFEIAGAVIPMVRLLVFLFALLLAAACYYVLTHTKLGQAIMATALDAEIASTMGVNPRRIYAVTAGIGAGLAGAAGNLAAIIFPVSPFMGIKFIGITFVVTVLGGVGSVQGCILAGLVYGLIQAFSGMVFGVNTQELSAFALFILVLLLRPHGLLGKRFFGEH